jgi:ligand-binding sensor domain-containing protein
LPQNTITALLQDQEHRIWAGTHEGLSKLIADPVPGHQVVESIFREKDGLGSDSIKVLQQLTDGTLCVGTKIGLSVSHADRAAGSQMFSTHTPSQGLPTSGVEALAEDVAGILWIGTDGSGAAKLLWKTFLTYTADDGLRGTQIDSIFEHAGKHCVVTRQGNTDLYVNEFDGTRFRATRVNLPPKTRLLNWGARTQSMAHDAQGNWWIGTSDGLFRYSGVSQISDLGRTLPAARYAEREGLSSGPVVSVFEDSAGSLWLSTTGKRMHSRGGIAMIGPSTAIPTASPGSRLPVFPCSPKTDRAGFGWGFYGSDEAKPRRHACADRRSSALAGAMMHLREESAPFTSTGRGGCG